MAEIHKFVYTVILFVSLVLGAVSGKSKFILLFFVLFIFYTIFHPFVLVTFIYYYIILQKNVLPSPIVIRCLQFPIL